MLRVLKEVFQIVVVIKGVLATFSRVNLALDGSKKDNMPSKFQAIH